MSFMQKLCDVYDAVIGTSASEGKSPLLPMWFTQKNIEFNIILSSSGSFITAQRLDEKAQFFTVPSTPQAECRSSDVTPFPLADSLKYLMDKEYGGKLESYLAQLETWCAAPHAPECLRILLTYLRQQTLYDDLSGVVGLQLQYDKDGKAGKGKDADKIACFSIEYPYEENRLWMRKDVQASWREQFLSLLAVESTALCYVTGQQLPMMKKHPYLQVTSRLISAKDNAYPMQYKGRFTEDSSAVTISVEAYARLACKRWLDVRAFGQVFAFKSDKKAKPDDETSEQNSSDGVSVGIRGPVSIQSAFSLKAVNVVSTQITKSVNLETGAAPDKKAPDTMGMKHRVSYAVYTTFGSINVQPASKTGFSEEDAEALKQALLTLFRNDATTARPDGSMEVIDLVWWQHNCPNGQYSSARVHRSLHVVQPDDPNEMPTVTVDKSSIEGLACDIIPGEY